MDGRIGVRSTEGKGSSFWFSIWFNKQTQQEEAGGDVFRDLAGLKVLAVDDSETNRTIMHRMLQSFGCLVTTAQSGSSAIHNLKEAVSSGEPFRVALIDMQMQGMNGEATATGIKGDPDIKDTELIMLTSIGIRGDAARLESIGCSGYLTKPIKQSRLYEAISAVIEQASPQKSSEGLFVTRHSLAEKKRQNTKVLLVEDHPVNRMLASKILKNAGFHVDPVNDGQQAVDTIQEHQYDVVLMDVQMPRMDGFEATRVIRTLEGASRHTPIIAMTAHAMQGDREKCLQAGMDDYIAKPLKSQDLLNLIKNWTKAEDQTTSSEDILEASKPTMQSIIDLTGALNRVGGDKEFYIELLKEFSGYAPDQIDTLFDAHKAKDYDTLEKEAHRIRGALMSLGANGAAAVAGKLEFFRKEHNEDTLPDLIHELKLKLLQINDYLEELEREENLETVH